MQDKIMSLYNGQIQFDERTFAKKILKIYKILKKLENGKNQKPNMSESFQELSNLLMQSLTLPFPFEQAAVYFSAVQKGYLGTLAGVAEMKKRVKENPGMSCLRLSDEMTCSTRCFDDETGIEHTMEACEY